MDIRQYMSTWLTNGELERRGDRYVGTIDRVGEETVRNKFTAAHEPKPVIIFADDTKLIPNIGMLRALAQMFGHETDGWHGKRIVVFRRRTERVDKTTGESHVRFECAVMAASDAMSQRTPADDNGTAPTRDDVPARADYDDREDEPVPAWVTDAD